LSTTKAQRNFLLVSQFETYSNMPVKRMLITIITICYRSVIYANEVIMYAVTACRSQSC